MRTAKATSDKEQIRVLARQYDDALRDLYVLSLRNNVKGFVQDLDFHGDIAERADQLNQPGSGGRMIGFFLNEKLVGFGAIRRIPSGNVELCNLHLRPDCQGRGIGKRLALELIGMAKVMGYKTVELHVTITQQPAIGLYQHLGFTKTGQRVYEISGETYDTLFMELHV